MVGSLDQFPFFILIIVIINTFPINITIVIITMVAMLDQLPIFILIIVVIKLWWINIYSVIFINITSRPIL